VLRDPDGCEIVIPFPLGSIGFMRRILPKRRLLVATGSVVVLALLSASVGYAAPAPRRVAPRHACGPNATSPRKLLPRVKSFGGPVKRPSARASIGLTEPTASLKRCCRANLADEDDPIQNDAPAAYADPDERVRPDLRSAGALHRPDHRLLRPRAFSPRSPRGPPVAA
jgi:hypothetical protein